MNDIDITGYVVLALMVLGVWFVLTVQRQLKQIAADVRAIREAAGHQPAQPPSAP
ncbi:hypothetical protein SAMN04488544_0061 [Microlunatus sagamiharensis]|uniref:Uncharacterized protein n=1 Tax=Microlunatus sagamiharensis TaxID=546874 RepID=A0A1H2LGA5_9ACTN|nr:hypothetical protein [Microlunatus sagamiharensis]SDU79854.1 hypothetical protein SAMN04488544_0061 [Microlunatus sagamiharensis]